MKRILLGLGIALLGGAAYLAFWPVSIDPQVWDAPVNPGYIGDFAPNNDLAELERLSITYDPARPMHGPEDVAIQGGAAFVSSQEGEIIRIDLGSGAAMKFAGTGGVPLGLEFDAGGNLIVADAHKGLLSIAPEGTVATLTNSVDGTAIKYADDLDIAADGVIYFSDASTKFGAAESVSTMAASLLEIMEHGETGRLLAYDPRTQETRVVADGFAFSNGVAMHPDGDVLLVETGTYKVWKINPASGARETFIDNMPGFPDNINRGPVDANGQASFILGLVSQRSDWLDENADKPGLRKLAMRLPSSMRPTAVAYTHLVHLGEDGGVIHTWQDPSGDYIDATGGIIHDGYLYVSSLHAPDLGRKKLDN